MADLTPFQEQAIETITTLEDVPMAVLYHAPNGPEMFLQNDHRDRNDYSPHISLLAAYVVQIAEQTDTEPSDVLYDIDDQINEWADEEIGIESHERGDFDDE
jgi:hypothetical protein